MKTELTKEQSQAVNHRGSNILVSAAAGSGKTKVLVDRIISKITDKENPVNVDEFLVVTFTKAAAAQMKDKIADKLSCKLDENPESEHLSRQQILINRANITTIDSFCLKIVKENINRLDIDTNFSIGDSGMMELIKGDTIKALFERKYKEDNNETEFFTFSELIDLFDEGKSDEKLKNTVFSIYNKASSYPQPDVWLREAKEALLVDDVKDLGKIPWIKSLFKEIKNNVKAVSELAEKALQLTYDAGGPENNRELVLQDVDNIAKLCEVENYDILSKLINISWGRLKPCRGDKYDSEIVEQFKLYRNAYKEMVKSISLLCTSPEKIIEENKVLKTYLVPLIELVEEFSVCYMEEKKLRKVLDFSDVEHYAYKLLVQGYDVCGKVIPTQLGINISRDFNEIFIDEYQDSNYLQEDILTAVSGISQGNYNMFMVGDVKQSIYRFRMARPDLFIDKYNTYKSKGNEVKIELKNNFRSRDVVLLPVNYFFYQLMGEDLGGISYDDSISLVPSLKFPDEKDSRISNSTEILLVEKKEELDKEDNNLTSAIELEAHAIAKRILELTNGDEGMLVCDEKLGYRNAEYKDIVILTRSTKNVGEVFFNVMGSYGIPVYLADPKGYFNAVEINVLVSLLSVVDNSRQDIPLAAVLLSPMAELNEEELALVCNYSSDRELKYLYDKCDLYRLDNKDNISKKLDNFLCILDELKQKKYSLSISDLIWLALDKTNYYAYVSAMPMGSRRRANIDMLIEKANAFENGYYKGLFNFLRYVEKLKINEVDFGEASIVGEGENVVRIMTMHASKGLEYPIVFVSALGKGFNKKDYTDKVIVHSDYYITAPLVNKNKRYLKKSTSREVFKVLNRSESIAEELRILYVAMTRAREKLILTGCVNNWKEYEDKYSGFLEDKEIVLPYNLRRDAGSFMELILKSMLRYKQLGKKLKVENLIHHTVYSKAEISEFISKKVTSKIEEVHDIKAMADFFVTSEIYGEYKKGFIYEYPYDALTKQRSKMSISDIKKQKAYNGHGYDESEFDHSSGDAVNKGMDLYENKKGLTGAERGTIVHKFMELLPFEKLGKRVDYVTFCKDYLQELKNTSIFDDLEASAISLHKIETFLMSDLGKRMINAASENKLFKEQQFSIGIPAQMVGEVKSDMPADDSDIIIVQGIIDGFFYEDDEIVVMDYKTDYADRDTLINRYKAQLDYYGETLNKITGKKIKEKIIYSFHLGQEIAW